MRKTIICGVLFGLLAPLAWGQSGLHGGREIYEAACAACHGPHGEGTPRVVSGFEPPETFPHFNKCDETTPEFTRDYKAVILNGGAARGFSHIMPSFSGALTSKQIDQVITYLRSFCSEPGWPLGELNVPRALVTEKAFPESETVITSAINTSGPAGVSNELDYEHVLGKRDQLEVAIPFDWARQEGGSSAGGIGDVAVGIKHVLFARLNAPREGPVSDSTGSILSVQGEVLLPTGSWRHGFGNGEPGFGVFAAYDQLFPAQTFLQLQGGFELPLRATHVDRSAYVRSAFGKTFSEANGSGRLWTPMLEFVADRDLAGGATTDYDVVAEFQVTLNRRQHVRAALGYLVPVNDTAGRPRQIELYFLWDWFDGGIREGW
ncbi:MAG TPA: c-type cytochrome [Steroidobacteraceae bacterium]|nr:c-type cytochrome [Steroidobacteraceae bacterium]